MIKEFSLVGINLTRKPIFVLNSYGEKQKTFWGGRSEGRRKEEGLI